MLGLWVFKRMVGHVAINRCIPENGWEKELTCWKPGESPPPPASNLESLPPSTSPLLFDEEDALSEPEGNVAASSSEPTVGEFLAFPASHFEDVPQDGKSVKGTGGPSPRSRYATPPPPPLWALRAHLVTKGQWLLAIHRVAPKAPEIFFSFPLPT